jgi:rare lipoprotein A (peptidoglycan hydrolase)
VDGRVIDLSLKAAREIDMVRSGTARVKLTVVKEGPPTATRTPRTSDNPCTGNPEPVVFAFSGGVAGRIHGTGWRV